MIPTFLGIFLINFVILQLLPGGPIEQLLASQIGIDSSATSRFEGAGADAGVGAQSQAQSGGEQQAQTNKGRRAQLDQEYIDKLKKDFDLDKPATTRFFLTLKRYAQFDFGESFFRGRSVIDLIVERLPVSISLGLWSTLLIYWVSIPLGIFKAVRDGSRFDAASSLIVVIANAIPSFLFALLLIIFFSGGRFLDWFPLRGLTSDNFDQLSLIGKVVDYLWHITLPVLAITISGFAGLTMLTKNSFLEQLGMQYVTLARAKGANERRVLLGHVFRNAMLIVIAGFPAALVGIFFTSSLLIEIIFSLDGLGLLGYEAIIQRDYPIVMASLYIFTLMGLVLGIISDLAYTWIDPRIDFEKQES